MVTALENHIIHRVDDIYLYPMPIHKSYVSLKQQNKFVHVSNSIVSLRKILKLQYVFPRQLKIDYSFQINLTEVIKLELSNEIGVSILHSSFTYVPTKLKATTAVLPKQCQQENEYSFVF